VLERSQASPFCLSDKSSMGMRVYHYTSAPYLSSSVCCSMKTKIILYLIGSLLDSQKTVVPLERPVDECCIGKQLLL